MTTPKPYTAEWLKSRGWETGWLLDGDDAGKKVWWKGRGLHTFHHAIRIEKQRDAEKEQRDE